MAATGTITISGSIIGTPGGTRTVGPFVISLPAAILGVIEPVLVDGANGPYAIPANANYCLIVPPSTNIATITLKGATGGDAGLPLNLTKPSLIGLGPDATALNILTDGPIPSGFEISFY